jgi:hypothetical protein
MFLSSDIEESGIFHGSDVTELCWLVLSPYPLVLLINGRTSVNIGKDDGMKQRHIVVPVAVIIILNLYPYRP